MKRETPKGDRTCRRSLVTGYAILVVFLSLGLVLAASRPAGSGFTPPSAAPHLYFSDASTLLFDDYEGTSFASGFSPNATFAAGYLGGQALYLPDTGSYVTYSDSWWAQNDANFQETGTIEFYYRPETFVFTGDQLYGCLLTMDERPLNPARPALPTLAVHEAGGLSWALSRGGAGGYHDALYSTDPALYPGQWYHIAATWSGSGLKLYINDTLVAEGLSDTFVAADTFMLGATGAVGLAEGLAARGRIDRFRLSWRPRAAGEFPRALDVRIDSPVGGETVVVPFPVSYQASASETRARTVDLYADTDLYNFNGTRLLSGLSESGTVLAGTSLPEGAYYLYAVARAGTDSAFFYMNLDVNVTRSLAFDTVVDPAETSTFVTITPVTNAGDSFTVVLLNGGGTTSGSLTAAADSIGTKANYTIRHRLLETGDTAVIHLWTKEVSPAIHLRIRSDTRNLLALYLPRGIQNNDVGLRAFGATILSTEFVTSDGRMLGDSRTTTSIGDTFVYTIEYQLSARTAALFRQLGFDTSAGSTSFSFFYADTYGARWVEDLSCTVRVVAGSNGGVVVRVQGITRDLPGGLGFASYSSATVAAASSSGGCLLDRCQLPEGILGWLRILRDLMIETSLGRILAGCYYWIGNACV